MSEWSKTPPTKAGWYWWRFERPHPTPCGCVLVEYLDGVLTVRGFTDLSYVMYREWRTTPIDPPA